MYVCMYVCYEGNDAFRSDMTTATAFKLERVAAQNNKNDGREH